MPRRCCVHQMLTPEAADVKWKPQERGGLMSAACIMAPAPASAVASPTN